MAKDAKGHGSDGRGGASNIDRNARGPGKHIGYGGSDVYHVQKSNGPKSDWYHAVGQKSGDVLTGKGLGEISAKLANKSAAQTLAGGHPKSETVPVHAGTSGPRIVGIANPNHIWPGQMRNAQRVPFKK